MWSLFIDQFLHNCTGGYKKKKYSKLVAGGLSYYFPQVVTQVDKAREFTAGWWHKVPFLLKTIRPSRVSLMASLLSLLGQLI